MIAFRACVVYAQASTESVRGWILYSDVGHGRLGACLVADLLSLLNLKVSLNCIVHICQSQYMSCPSRCQADQPEATSEGCLIHGLMDMMGHLKACISSPPCTSQASWGGAAHEKCSCTLWCCRSAARYAGRQTSCTNKR